MSNPNDFVIENGLLKGYTGPGGDVVVPEGVTSVGSWAFSGCRSLTSITLPEGVTSIPDLAFSRCRSLTSVTLPESLTSIGSYAFSDCSSLTSITLPEGVTSIRDHAFYGCSSLTSITLPEGVTSIGDDAFYDCRSLTSITLPEGVTSIGGSAFSRCRSLTSVTLPEGVTSIGDSAFYGCSSLTSITLPESLTSIGIMAFSDCSSLKAFTLTGNNAKLIKGVFGSSLPEGLAGQLSDLYPCMVDGALKQYVLDNKIWRKLDTALKAEIFLARQGKALDSAYTACVEPSDLEGMGAAILDRLGTVKPSSKDCAAAAGYMTLFHKSASAETLKAIYGKLKQIKAGAKAVKTAEANVELMEKLGSAVTVDTSLSPAAQKVMAVLITEKRNAKDLEKTFKDFYSLTYKDLPILQAVDGNAVEPLVAAWLFTAHEKLKQGAWGQPDVVAGYQKAGLRPEAEEIISLLDGNVLQDALLKLADGNLGMSSRSKKKFLAYPICRYADEALMAELCVRAPKWRSSVSGNDAPPLKSFRDAAKYSNTRAAMLFAERYHELDQYAAIRSTDADTIRDQFLSDVGLDKQGGKVYDLGTQTVTARLQKDLSFLFELPGDKTAKSLPKKGADPDKYAAANKDFTEMKKSVKKILNSRGNVLFGEFLSGRERAASDWKDAYLKNPLLREAASLVVWAQGKQTFTLRDGAPLDSKEQPYAITDEPIRVAHPMEMNADDVKAWQKYFTRHGLKQPFQQIWEPVHSAGEIAADRYTGILLPLVFFKNAEKHGLKYQYLDSVDIELQDCEARYNVAGERRHELDPDAAVEITDFRIPSYTRQANHIVALLDRWTARERIAKDDLAVMGLMPGFTLAQITEFISAAQEANATNVLAALLEYKNANFADFDPMDEFTLEW